MAVLGRTVKDLLSFDESPTGKAFSSFLLSAGVTPATNLDLESRAT
jgi:hypothetical protein